MIIGLTGTRYGLTDAQVLTAARLIAEFGDSITEWHQGGCVGADWQVSYLLYESTSAHQHIWPGRVAAELQQDWEIWFPERTVVHEEMPPLERNKVIVTYCDWLWAFPQGEEVLRSGTWATIRHADRTVVNYDVVGPDGVRRCTGNSTFTG